MNLNKNYIGQSAILICSMLTCFISLSLLPTSLYKSLGFKEVNILSDLMETSSKKSKLSKKSISTNNLNAKQNPNKTLNFYLDSITSIENIANDSASLAQLAVSIKKYINNEKPFRIAFFGDSFVEGDMVTGDLRDTLQHIYGYSGIGYMPITSQVAGYRITIQHSFSKDWKTYSIIDKPRAKANLGISGYSFIPANGSWVNYHASKRKGLDSFDLVKIIYTGASGEKITVNNKEYMLEISPEIQMLTLEIPKTNKVKIIAEQLGNLAFYGVSIEKKNKGILVDNFSMRGNSGIGLSAVKTRTYMLMDSLLQYDLVILQYGLNVANEDYTNYDWYSRGMKPVLKQFNTAFKNCPKVLMSVSDRGNKNGTMNGIVELLEVQKKMATDNHFLFYNLFDAMGGEGSMLYFVDHNMANKDYTHLTFKGGHFVGVNMAKAISHMVDEIKKNNIEKENL